MKKSFLSAAGAVAAAGLILAPVAAFADDAPVEDTTTAPVEEVTPVEEPVEAPVTPEAPEEVSAPVEEPAEPVEVTPPAEEEPSTTEPPVTEEPPVVEPVEETITLRWTLPDGGTPDNVTWPQPVFVPTAIECGTSVWVQVDTYPYTTDEDKARTEALAADGALTQGEDYGWAQSWTFEEYEAPACEEPPTEEPPVEEPPVVEPPVEEPPVVEPPVVEPPVVEEPVVAAAAADFEAPETLAQTGADPLLLALGLPAGVAALALGGLLIARRRQLASEED